MQYKMLAVIGMASILALGVQAQQQSQTLPGQSAPGMAGQVQTNTLGLGRQTAPEQSSFRSSVTVVSTPVVIRNGKGELITDLNEKDIRVSDNGVQQPLEAFEMDAAPLSVAIVVENSSRVEPLLPSLHRAGRLFAQTVLGEKGEAALISYNDEVVKLLGFTNDESAIEKAFVDLQTGTSGAYLYDAMSKAVQMLRNVPSSRRRVIITVAEALDTGSNVDLNQVLRDAQVDDITIYSVGLSTVTAEVQAPLKQAASLRVTPVGTYGLPAIPGIVNTPTIEQLRSGNIDVGGVVRPVWAFVGRKPPMEAAVGATGGSYQDTDAVTSVEKAIDQIAAELNAQYTLTYRRIGDNTLGFHQIKVEVAGQRDLKVRTRSGYYILQP